jgi:hypothetical protein
MSESINDASLGGVVGRHFHFHAITDCKPNETFAHLSGNVRENEMIVREGDAKHGPRQDRRNRALQLDGFFRIHRSILVADLDAAARRPYQTRLSLLPAKIGETPLSIVATRPLFARTRFVNG